MIQEKLAEATQSPLFFNQDMKHDDYLVTNEDDQEFESILNQFSIKMEQAAAMPAKRKLKPNIGSKWILGLQKRIKQSDHVNQSSSRKHIFDSP
jgi:hypothetical protein